MKEQPTIKVGQTLVSVYRFDPQSGMKTCIHEGVVVQDAGTFVRVWNYKGQGSETEHQEHAQLYPLHGYRMFCVVTGELEKPVKIVLAFWH